MNPTDERTPQARTVIVHTDGCSLGNPGPAGAAVVILTPEGERLTSASKSLGRATNNEAEYAALLLGLEEARKLGAARVEVRSDSELIVRQVRGEYRIRKPHLMPLVQQARKAMAHFERVTLISVPRESNEEADALAKAAAASQA